MKLFTSKKDRISYLEKEVKRKDKKIKQLERRCLEKDSHFKRLMSDGLKHGSPLAASYMADRKKYLKGL